MKKAYFAAVAALIVSLSAASAFAQSSGSFAGDFVSVDIIPTITCSATDPALSCTNGGVAFLGATIKVPGASSKDILIGGSLQTALFTRLRRPVERALSRRLPPEASS